MTDIKSIKVYILSVFAIKIRCFETVITIPQGSNVMQMLTSLNRTDLRYDSLSSGR